MPLTDGRRDGWGAGPVTGRHLVHRPGLRGGGVSSSLTLGASLGLSGMFLGLPWYYNAISILLCFKAGLLYGFPSYLPSLGAVD